MTVGRNDRIPGRKEDDSCRERRPSGGSGKREVGRKCLMGTIVALAEWKLGRGGRPVGVRLQELAFLFVLCRVAVCDAKTGKIPNRFVGEILALASAGFL